LVRLDNCATLHLSVLDDHAVKRGLLFDFVFFHCFFIGFPSAIANWANVRISSFLGVFLTKTVLMALTQERKTKYWNLVNVPGFVSIWFRERTLCCRPCKPEGTGLQKHRGRCDRRPWALRARRQNMRRSYCPSPVLPGLLTALRLVHLRFNSREKAGRHPSTPRTTRTAATLCLRRRLGTIRDKQSANQLWCMCIRIRPPITPPVKWLMSPGLLHDIQTGDWKHTLLVCNLKTSTLEGTWYNTLPMRIFIEPHDHEQ
jgi:hypothetical protein